MGGLAYDQEAELFPGAKYAEPPAEANCANEQVEVHLVERQDEPTGSDRAEAEDQPAKVPWTADGLSDLTALEKEAVIIGRRIQIMVQGTAERPDRNLLFGIRKASVIDR